MALSLSLTGAFAGGFLAPPAPPIGTRTVATADLLVSPPKTTPCSVTLFTDHDFIGFDPYPFTYTPPAECPGPWAKVVLQADLSVTAGVQFDRTAVIDIGGVNVYFGTTMEPSGTTARQWHVEREVTDIAATLMVPQSGEAILYNVVDQQYTGHEHAAATLQFYPASPTAPAAVTAQTVIPMAPSLTALSPTNPVLSKAVTLPQNTVRLYMDLVAQSQGGDEFWYTCVPDQFATVLQSCPGGSFREVEVAIDGTPAGVAPVFPWIYSGGISPSLWIPTPGVQTLNFKPSRVDLTPFAGVLDDGQPHTVSLQVFDAQDNFSVTATLLAFGDPKAQVVTGSLVSDTLTLPVVNVLSNGLKVDGANAQGRLSVKSARDYTIVGTVNTSRGAVTTTVASHIAFSNIQHFDINSEKYKQHIDQRTDVRTVTTVAAPNGTSKRTALTHYPLTVNFLQSAVGGVSVLDEAIAQEWKEVVRGVDADGSAWVRAYDDTVTPHIHRQTGQASTMDSAQHLFVKTTGIGCYDRTITVTLNAVSAVQDRCTR
ncbi:MAG TPA: peptide-N4-asparagine amidase [Burkholderiaceae bacterium]|nr:peptide-N4-asparagine amidase [Burkholderiaceae bacterium]